MREWGNHTYRYCNRCGARARGYRRGSGRRKRRMRALVYYTQRPARVMECGVGPLSCSVVVSFDVWRMALERPRFFVSVLRGCEVLISYLDPGPKGPSADLICVFLVDFVAYKINEVFGNRA